MFFAEIVNENHFTKFSDVGNKSSIDYGRGYERPSLSHCF